MYPYETRRLNFQLVPRTVWFHNLRAVLPNWEEISKKIAELVTPENLNCKIKVIFQTVENLHKACPNNTGDWYFTGDYPTPGGTRTAIHAFINFYEGNPYKRGYSR